MSNAHSFQQNKGAMSIIFIAIFEPKERFTD